MRLLIATTLFLGLMATAAPMPVMAQDYDAYGSAESGNDTMAEVYDPIEPFNRAVFTFNKYVDKLVLKPVTKVYTTITPDFVEAGVTNFLANLSAPVVFLNTVLQGDSHGAGVTFGRFVINTTFGIGGLFDVASHANVQPVQADFGQTLGKWGVGQGAYLVLPFFGPSSVRDGSGRVVDTVADPYNLYFAGGDRPEWPIYARAGLAAIDARARYGDEIDNITNNAVDPYSTFRSIYLQRRAYFVQGKTNDPALVAAKNPVARSKKAAAK